MQKEFTVLFLCNKIASEFQTLTIILRCTVDIYTGLNYSPLSAHLTIC